MALSLSLAVASGARTARWRARKPPLASGGKWQGQARDLRPCYGRWLKYSSLWTRAVLRRDPTRSRRKRAS